MTPSPALPAPPRANTLAWEERIEKRLVRVGIIGLGYVGLPLSMVFTRAGFPVCGFDTDELKIQTLQAGRSYIRHLDSQAVAAALGSGRLEVTSNCDRLAEMDAILICVPTPLNETREPDLSYVVATARAIAARLRPGQLIVLESSTYPGTTEEVLLPVLEKGGLRCSASGGEERVFLAYSPEREDPGNRDYSTQRIPKLVGGLDATSGERARQLYAAAFDRVIQVSSTQVAEMAKILENTYRCVNIALVNELKQLCLRMGIDICEVIDAAATKPFGFQAFYPGPGLGGHCIPIDPFYLSWKARQHDFTTRFIELAGEINTEMPYRVVEFVAAVLNQNERAVKGSQILILGVAYKKDIDDLRESPALKIISLLRERGARVTYHDPHIPHVPPSRHYAFEMTSIPLTPQTLAAADCVLLVTDHSSFDMQQLVTFSRALVDTRNATRGFNAPHLHRC